MLRKLLQAIVAVALVAGSVLAVATPAAHAVMNYTVTTTADGGAGSLRAAIALASSDADASVIDLAANAEYVLTDCSGAGGDLNHTENDLLTINGNGSTIRQSCAGQRVLLNTGTGTTTINDVTITGGTPALNGGGINTSGAISLIDSEVTGNSATTGGGIFSSASVTLTRSAVTGNTATNIAGGVASDTAINVNFSTVAGNTADSAAALEATDVVLESATVAGNNTSGVGNSDIESDTLVSRRSAVGDSLGIQSACGSFTETSNGYNADDDGTCGFTQPTDQSNVASLGLLPLGGSAPRFRLPGTTSVLLNAIPSTPVNQCAADEQRLVPRPQVTGGSCDIGAVEAQVPTAADDSYSLSGPTSLAVRANDTDPDNRVVAGGLTISVTPSNGTATVQPDFTVLYTPAFGYAGLDSFEYRLCGAGEPVGQCQTATVTLTVFNTSRFVPLPPQRLFDTRPGTDPGPKGFVNAGTSIDVQVTGVGGVPSTGVSAVVMNVTATEAAGAGFVTVWPTGQARPNASNLNLITAGQTAPNLVTVPVGAGGMVSMFTQGGAHLLADVAGYYTGAVTSTGGRLVPLNPVRIFDSRPDTAESGPKGFVGAGQSVAVQVAGAGGVPSSGVSAVVLNITGTEAAGDGFVTVWPGGANRPNASNLNLSSGQSTPNLVTVGIGNGTVNLFSQTGAHLIADVTGYYTDGTAPSSGAGLFVPLQPGRVSDTRPGTDPGPKGLVGSLASIDVQVTGVVGVPASAAAAVLNLTATEAVAAGFVTGWPAGEGRPVASNLNLNSAGETRPNAAILRLGAGGRISLFSQSGTHLVVDTSGYFTGAT